MLWLSPVKWFKGRIIHTWSLIEKNNCSPVHYHKFYGFKISDTTLWSYWSTRVLVQCLRSGSIRSGPTYRLLKLNHSCYSCKMNFKFSVNNISVCWWNGDQFGHVVVHRSWLVTEISTYFPLASLCCIIIYWIHVSMHAVFYNIPSRSMWWIRHYWQCVSQ